MCASKSLSILSVKRKLDDFIRRQKILMQLNRLFGMRFDKQTDEKLKKKLQKIAHMFLDDNDYRNVKSFT